MDVLDAIPAVFGLLEWPKAAAVQALEEGGWALLRSLEEDPRRMRLTTRDKTWLLPRISSPLQGQVQLDKGGQVRVRIPRLYAESGGRLLAYGWGCPDALEAEAQALQPLLEALGVTGLEEALAHLPLLREGEALYREGYFLGRRRRWYLRRGAFLLPPGEELRLYEEGQLSFSAPGGEGRLEVRGAVGEDGIYVFRNLQVVWKGNTVFHTALFRDPPFGASLFEPASLGFALQGAAEHSLSLMPLELTPRFAYCRALFRGLVRAVDPLGALRKNALWEEAEGEAAMAALSRL